MMFGWTVTLLVLQKMCREKMEYPTVCAYVPVLRFVVNLTVSTRNFINLKSVCNGAVRVVRVHLQKFSIHESLLNHIQ